MGIKFDAALTGFNNNFRHKGKVYHLQTEDSGAGHPHIITHVFVDGHIIATRKSSYEEHVGRDDLKDIVRSLMREQHKAMALAIRDGVFDEEGQSYAREVKPSRPPGAESAVEEEKKKSRLRGISGVYRSVRRRGSKPPPPPRPAQTGKPAGVVRVARGLSTSQARPPREVDPSKSEHAFGEELLTDKTLEEVIASYLSEDVAKG
jgi:hypothetical protein